MGLYPNRALLASECCEIFVTRIDGVMASSAPSVVGASTENILSGTIRWEVDKDSITKNNLFSDEIEVGGIKWALCAVLKNNGEGNDSTAAGVFLFTREGDYNMRSVNAAYEMKLLNHKDDSKTITGKSTRKFGYDDSWGFNNVIKWNDAIDIEKGFIKDNKFTILCEFKMSNIIGFRKLRRIGFTDPLEPSHDVVIAIDGEKFYVSKQHLSILSPVFHTMFYGDFAEKNKKEIELKDIDCKEFSEMLCVIYPPHKKITDQSVVFLLKLSDRFEINMVSERCEQFLITSSTLDINAKLLLADQYLLNNLLNHCLDQLTTTKAVRDLKDSDVFPVTIVTALFDKMMKLTD